MLSVWPPARLLSVAAVVVLLSVAGVFLVATHQPWLGIKFGPNPQGDGLVVEAVHRDSPNAALQVGDVVIGILSGGTEQRVDASLLIDDAIILPTYREYNQFRERHRALWEALSTNQFAFVLPGGRTVTGHTIVGRPGFDLPWTFWLLTANGAASVLIAIGIWAFRRESGISRVLLIGGVSIFAATLCNSLMFTRELTLSPGWFEVLSRGNGLGTEAFSFSMFVLLWYYPIPLRRFPVASIAYGIVVLDHINSSLQFFEYPGHATLLIAAVGTSGVVLLGVYKWRFVRYDAVSRAALNWFLLTLVVGGSVAGITFFYPILITGEMLVPTAITYIIPTFIFIGLAFGIARYRLFDLERWWLEVWLWLVGGLVVVALDFALIAIAGISSVQALGVAIIVAGWAYLPARQWLFRRMLKTSQTRLENHLPALVETLFREASVISFADRWKELLQRVFAPMTTAAIGTPLLQSAVTESGAALRVPSLDGSGVIELRHRDQGSQLYHPRDAALADTMLTLTRRTAGLWDAKEEGARTERTRIMRDLHDDVAARLLTLVHAVSDQAQQTQVREAIGSLRHVIYALDDHKLITLADFLDELQAQLRERVRHTSTALNWQEPAQLPVATLSPRERINLTRAVQEATSNCLRHAQPTRLTVTPSIEGGQLRLHICNDGNILRMEDWSLGKGVHNIKTRMSELGGLAEWSVQPEKQSDQKLCCLTLSVPLANLSSP